MEVLRTQKDMLGKNYNTETVCSAIIYAIGGCLIAVALVLMSQSAMDLFSFYTTVCHNNGNYLPLVYIALCSLLSAVSLLIYFVDCWTNNTLFTMSCLKHIILIPVCCIILPSLYSLSVFGPEIVSTLYRHAVAISGSLLTRGTVVMFHFGTLATLYQSRGRLMSSVQQLVRRKADCSVLRHAIFIGAVGLHAFAIVALMYCVVIPKVFVTALAFLFPV